MSRVNPRRGIAGAPVGAGTRPARTRGRGTSRGRGRAVGASEEDPDEDLTDFGDDDAILDTTLPLSELWNLRRLGLFDDDGRAPPVWLER